jgi:hypothetical protein
MRFVAREVPRRAIARLLIAALVIPAPTAVAAPASSPASAGFTAADPPAASCSDTLASGAFPAASTARSELWPPNHVLVDVGLRVDVGEACLGLAPTRLAVYSDEGDDATGDGSTVHDAQLDPPDLYLRAERQGSGDGRVYLIAVTATDDGAAGRACASVVVPKSQSRKHRDHALAQASAALQACEAGDVPAGFQLLLEAALDSGNQAPLVDATRPGIGAGAVQAHRLRGRRWQPAGSPRHQVERRERPARDARMRRAPGPRQLRCAATTCSAQRGDALSPSTRRSSSRSPTPRRWSMPARPVMALRRPPRHSRQRSTTATAHDSVLSWTQVSSPTGVLFSQPSSATTGVELPGEGVFELFRASTASSGRRRST